MSVSVVVVDSLLHVTGHVMELSVNSLSGNLTSHVISEVVNPFVPLFHGVLLRMH